MRMSLILCLLTGPFAHAGWYVGNGGDAIFCKPSALNQLHGYYSIDYLLTLASASGPDGIARPSSWDDSSKRILKILEDKVPGLAGSFKDFSRLVYNKSFAEKRVWEPAAFGLTDLNDERITARLPENCKTDGTFKIIQAVIRQFEGFSGTRPGQYVYKFVPDLLNEMNEQNPVQLSFLMVHEWLWDVSSNVDRNRRINRFLHSQAIESMAAEEVTATLTGMGLQIPGKAADAFDGDQWQGYQLTKEQFFERYPNNFAWANLGQLKLDLRERLMSCESAACDPNWRAPVFVPDVLKANRFFLSPAWEGSQTKEYPLKIISPDLVRGAWDSRAGLIECKFVDDPLFNLECRFKDHTLVWPLTGEYTHDLPPSRYPIAKANITEESFRMVVRGRRSVEVFGPGPRNNRTEFHETEAAFTMRFRWPGVSTFNTAACEMRLRAE